MSRDQADHETDHQGDGLTIAAAALALGVSENAVRQRIKRESIDARKIEGMWRIWLPDEPAPVATGRPLPSDHETDYQPDHEASGRDKPRDHQATSTAAAVETIPALIAQFESIRDQWLRPFVEDLNAKSERIGQLQERLATTEQRLAAAEQERDALRLRIENEPSDSRHSMKVEESSQDADVAPGAAEADPLSAESNTAPASASRSVFEDLWRWVRGR